MEVHLKDVHESHGLVFILDIVAKEGARKDKKVLKALNRLLAPIAADKNSVLYVYNSEADSDRISFSLSEGTKRMAKVDYRWNFRREDQKLVVVVLEGDKENNEDFSLVTRYACHVCGEKIWGVDRERMEVYDFETKSVKEVNAHDACKLEHLKKTADKPNSFKITEKEMHLSVGSG